MRNFYAIAPRNETIASHAVSLGLHLTAGSAIEFTSPPWLPAAEKRTNALLNLKENWDGEGAQSCARRG